MQKEDNRSEKEVNQEFTISPAIDRAKRPVLGRLLIPLIILIIALITVSQIYIWQLYQNNLQKAVLQSSDDIQQDITKTIQQKTSSLLTISKLINHSSDLKNRLINNDKNLLFSEYSILFEELEKEIGLTHFNLIDSNFITILRLHSPNSFGDTITRETLRLAKSTKTTATGIETGTIGALTLRVVTPVIENDKVLGYVEVGIELTRILNLIYERRNVELSLLLFKNQFDIQFLENRLNLLYDNVNLNKFERAVLIYSTTQIESMEFEEFVNSQNEINIQAQKVEIVDVDNSTFAFIPIPIKNIQSNTIGAIISANNITAEKEAFNNQLNNSILLSIFLIVIISLYLYFLLKKAEKSITSYQNKLADSKAFNDLLLDTLPVPYFYKDTDGRYGAFNKAFEEFFGSKQDDLIGKSVFDINPKELAEIYHAKDKEIFDNPGRQIYSAQIKTAYGLRDVIFYKATLLDALGNNAGLIGLILDNTEQKLHEEINQSRLTLLSYAEKHTLSELLTATLDEVEKLTASKIAFYHFVEEDQETLSLQAWSTSTSEKFCTALGAGFHYPISEAGVWVDCVREGKPIIHNDYSSLSHKKGLPKGHAPVIRELLVPIYRNAKIVAILGVGNKSSDYDEQDIEIVESLADLAWEITEIKRSKEALIESEKHLQSIFRASPTGIGLVRNRVLVEINTTVCNMLGYNIDELIGQSSRILYPNQEEFEYVGNEKYKQIAEKGSGTVETLWQKKNGDIINVLLSSSPIDINDLSKGVTFTVLDITEQKKSERALEESEKKYRQLFDISPNPNFIINRNGRFIQCNKSAEYKYGYSQEEFLEMTPVQLAAENSKDKAIEKVKRSQSEELHFEWIHIKKSGVEFPVEIHTKPMIIDGQSVVLVEVIDISERKKYEDSLRRHNELVESLLKNLKIGVFMVEVPSGRPLIANEWAQKLLGRGIMPDVTRDNLGVVYKAKKMGTDKQYPIDEMPIVLGMNGISAHIDDMVVERPDGTESLLEVFGTPIQDENGKVWASLVSFYDITERKKAETEIQMKNIELAELNVQKDKFFSIIAHDLRSPFSGLLGLTQIMSEEIEELSKTEISEIAKEIRFAINNLYKLLENLLEWSRMQHGGIEFQPVLTQLTTIIKNNISVQLKSAEVKEIKLKFDAADEIFAFADIEMLNAILRNLISNAIKFTMRGGEVQIGASYIASTGEESAGGFVQIYVKDNGIGMDSITLKRLFMIEHKVSQPGTENEPSTGLGLLLCKEFVERHGGSIWVESELGKGSTFYFTLPENSNDISLNIDN
jgi:PAS domain S-box-containing protein